MAENGEGYVVLDGEGEYLNRNFHWTKFDDPEGTHVFTREEVDEIRKRSKNESWQSVPVKVIPAKWDEDSTKLEGGELNITDLPEIKKN